MRTDGISTVRLNELDKNCLFFFLVVDDPGTSNSSGSPGSDQTDLFTWRSVSPDGRWFTDMLMITTTVGMFDWILGDTSNLWPTVPLDSELVVSSSGFQHRFIDSSTTGDETEHGSVLGSVELFDSGRKLDSGFAGVGVVGDDGAVTA